MVVPDPPPLLLFPPRPSGWAVMGSLCFSLRDARLPPDRRSEAIALLNFWNQGRTETEPIAKRTLIFADYRISSNTRHTARE